MCENLIKFHSKQPKVENTGNYASWVNMVECKKLSKEFAIIYEFMNYEVRPNFEILNLQSHQIFKMTTQK